MKTITFFKRVLASAALVSVCGFACATNNGKQFIHNDTMEGGKLVCREIYAMNDAASGILNPVKMYKYSYDTDDDNNPTFTTKLVFGLNGTYTYKLSDDKKTAELTNTDTKAVSTLKKTDDPDFIPTPDKDASIDDKLVGCWKSESGEYLCFDKSGIMYQNLFDYMFAYSNYTASEGKIVSTYTTSDKKTTDKYTYSVDGDTLTLNNDTYSRISFSDLK